MTHAERIIFDTDIGTDVDDALALAFILRSPELQPEGVTCVYGDVDLRARMVIKMLQLCGHLGHRLQRRNGGFRVRSHARNRGVARALGETVERPRTKHGHGVRRLYVVRPCRAYPSVRTQISERVAAEVNQ